LARQPKVRRYTLMRRLVRWRPAATFGTSRRKRRPEGLALADARARKAALDWSAYQPPIPEFLGARAIGPVPLQDLVPYIDWMPFFNAWEFPGKFPDILRDPVRGAAASALWEDARRMLDRLVDGRWLTARAVLGFFPAAGSGDDIEVFDGVERTRRIATLHHLRQQKIKPAGQPQFCLADYVAPLEESGGDFVGAFAVTAGIGIEEHVARFEAAHDDYSAIVLKALADRFVGMYVNDYSLDYGPQGRRAIQTLFRLGYEKGLYSEKPPEDFL